MLVAVCASPRAAGKVWMDADAVVEYGHVRVVPHGLVKARAPYQWASAASVGGVCGGLCVA